MSAQRLHKSSENSFSSGEMFVISSLLMTIILNNEADVSNGTVLSWILFILLDPIFRLVLGAIAHGNGRFANENSH